MSMLEYFIKSSDPRLNSKCPFHLFLFGFRDIIIAFI